MTHNPYVAPQISAEQTEQDRHPRGFAKVARRAILLAAITFSGLVGIIGGVFALVIVWPGVRETDYFVGLLGVSAMLGGLAAAFVTSFVLKRVLSLIGL